MIKKLAIFCICLLWTCMVQAQSKDIGMIAKVEKGKIILRWMPLNYKAWKEGNAEGYTLLRRTIAKAGKPQNDAPFLVLTPQKRKPLAQPFWENMGKTNKFAHVAGKLLYEPVLSHDTTAQNLNFALCMQMSCMSTSIANGLGMLFEDKLVASDEEYQYALVLSGKKLVFLEVNAAKITRLKAPANLYGEYSQGEFFMRWQMTDALMHTAYILERSDDGGGTFKAPDPNPILISQEPDSLGRVFVSKLDKLPKLYQNYFYRVRAITPFGQLSEPSNVLRVYGYKDKLPLPKLSAHITPKGVLLQWSFPDSLLNDIQGFKILRAKKLGEKYYQLSPKMLSRKARSFVDSLPLNSAYYRVALLDYGGKEVSSYPEMVILDDTLPPAQPRWYKPTVSPKGIVQLRWKPHKESDFYGYSIFRGDAKTHEFSIITRRMIQDTLYHDTLSLNLLNKNVYYTIVAYDKRLNASIHADTILVKRPDIIPPSAPNFTHYVLSDTSIVLHWENSPSADLFQTLLLRKSTKDTSYSMLDCFMANENLKSFTDYSAQPNTEYEYRLVAYDDAGLSNKEPCKIQLSLLDLGLGASIKDLTIAGDSLTRKIVLSWKYQHPAIDKFLIYRKKGNGYLSEYKYVPASVRNFEETQVLLDVPYSYAIMALYKDGRTSKLSRSVSITLFSQQK